MIRGSFRREVVGLADGPAIVQGLRWLLESGARGKDAESRFDCTFLAEVSIRTVRRVLAAALGRARQVRVDNVEFDETEAFARVVGRRGPIAVELCVAKTPPNLITRFVARPWKDVQPPTTLSDLEDRLRGLAANVRLLVVNRRDGELAVRLAIDADHVGPVASSFKVWVLGAVVAAIEAGSLTWDQRHTHGTRTLSVVAACREMFAVSDNDATDLLIDLVGPEAVLNHLKVIGISDATLDRNSPFLSVAQAFQLKLASPAVQRAYSAASVDSRKALLDRLPPSMPSIAELARLPQQPAAIYVAEWFASPRDLANAMNWLDQRVDDPGLEPLRSILGANETLDRSRHDSDVWFKGGDEDGVRSGCWLLRSRNADATIVVVSADDPDSPIDPREFLAISEAAATLSTT